ncbi:formate/nitrite transporter FocA (FNT family) [Brevirhabdus pacifica]|uniref:formate/nitrite transporter family protein n=1 Tax=Brevirhabdus pacifica TaxID=1267768 RepID=UPI0009F9BA93|nr:formate/nitrite transporter family protein [Brevirhabdus pacifica]PJJ85480.1 formate/nitrite transporter FocA (FNT family) [Brevirhabdus pacifica]
MSRYDQDDPQAAPGHHATGANAGPGADQVPAEAEEKEENPFSEEREQHAPKYQRDREEKAQIAERQGLSSVTVYSIVRHEGIEELSRPVQSLWWSGVAAGIGITTSVYAEAILHTGLQGHPYLSLLESLGYTVGFVLVILSRLQLFTENTLTVILPLLNNFSLSRAGVAARLWGVVFAANLTGAAATMAVTLYFGTATAEHIEAMLVISREYAHNAGWTAMWLGVPAGFFIAALVWMLPSSRGFEIFTIILFTFLIAAGGLTHVVAGSAEAFLLVFNGEMGVFDAAFTLILPTFIGNVLGGTGLFALLAYAQVEEEL